MHQINELKEWKKLGAENPEGAAKNLADGENLTILMITLAAIHGTLEQKIMKMDEVMQIFLINLYV